MLSSPRWIWFPVFLATASCTTDRIGPRVAAEVAAALREDGSAEVIVNLREATDPAQIARLSRAVLASLEGTTPSFAPTHVYRNVPAFAGRLTDSQLERLRTDPDVSFVQIAHGFSGQLLEAVPSVGVDRARERFGLTGRGVRVAVLDSGADLTHPDLESAIVAQRCFTRGDCTPWGLNEGTEALDEHGHGTRTAGTIASRGMRGPLGFAPEAELVLVRLQNDQNRGSEVDMIAGLDWLIENQSELSIDVVAFGMGTDILFEDTAACDRAQPSIARAIKTITDAGIIVVGASGNRGSATGSTAPGCNTGVVTAAATYDADVGAQPANGETFADVFGPGFDDCGDETTKAGQIACYSNTPARVDVVVPGGPMLTTTLGGGTGTSWGTSQSAAVMGGMAALLRQCNPSLSGAAFRRALVETGEPREDPKSGRMIPFVRLAEAARVACPDLPPEEVPAADGGMATPGEPMTGTAGTPGTTPPDVTGPTERGPLELLGRYTGGSRADPLGDQSPVGPRDPSTGGKDAGVRGDAASADDAAVSERERGERVSSCTIGLHGPRPLGPESSGTASALALLGLVFALRRARRVRHGQSAASVPSAQMRVPSGSSQMKSPA